MNKYESLKLQNQLCFPIYLCSKEIVKHYTPYLEKLDLTYTQYIVMLYLWENKQSNIKDLGKALKLDSGTLTPLLKKLENKKYISRKRNKCDERNLDIKLTTEGIKLRENAVDIPKKMGECISLSKEEILQLYSLIYKIINNIEKE